MLCRLGRPGYYAVGIYTALQAYRCGASFALVTLGTISMYAIFTLSVTQWRRVSSSVHNYIHVCEGNICVWYSIEDAGLISRRVL